MLFIHSISVIYSHITLTHHTTRTTEFSRRRPPGTGATGTQSESQMLADRMGLALYLCTALYVCLYGTLSLYRACTLPQFPFPRIPGSKEAVPRRIADKAHHVLLLPTSVPVVTRIDCTSSACHLIGASKQAHTCKVLPLLLHLWPRGQLLHYSCAPKSMCPAARSQPGSSWSVSPLGAAGRAMGGRGAATIMAGAIAACRRRVRKKAKAEAALPTVERTTGYSVGTKVLTATV